MTEQDILRVVDSCGGAEQSNESADWNRGYNEALDAVESELKRYFERSAHALKKYKPRKTNPMPPHSTMQKDM